MLRDSLVSANGHDGQRYNGDGVELNSTGATVTGNTITHNGDGVGFEHGIYAGATANHYTITGNTIGANAGADVKAAGGPGLVADNRLNSGPLRRRALGQPGGRDGAVQPHPGPLPARRPADDGRDAGARAALEQHRAADRPLDLERQRLGGVRRPAPRNSTCATTSSRTRTPMRSARR